MKDLSPDRPRRVKVFISGPYTFGDVHANVTNHLEMFDHLMDLGYAPFAPLLFHYAPQREYEDWIELDLDYLDVCDVIIRMPGPSKGADNEVDYAGQKGIPVVHSVEELVKLFPVNQQ